MHNKARFYLRICGKKKKLRYLRTSNYSFKEGAFVFISHD